MKKSIVVGFIILLLATLSSGMYTVAETERAVVTRFGKLLYVEEEAGLHWKTPWLNSAEMFSKQILDWDGQRGQMITADKKYIWVDTFARWHISDLELYYTSVRTRASALSKLDDVIDPATRNIIQRTDLLDIVRTTNRELGEVGDFSNVTIGREKVVGKVLTAAQKKVGKFGIELIDFKLKRVNYIDTVRQKVYGRMSAERNQKAAEIRSEGEAAFADILGSRDKELKRITSDASRKAQEIRGAADAEAARIYADAYDVDPKFYDFYKKLEMYRASAGTGTELYMTTGSDLWNLTQGLH